MSANVERMSRVDTAWLRMDTEANLMMIVGIWLIEPQLSLADLRERVESSLLKYGRFRQKVVEDALGAQWVDDDHFDIAAHVVPEKLELGAGPVADGRAQALRRRPHHRSRSTRAARCGSSTCSRTSRRAAPRSSRASTTASPTASR